MGAAGVHIEETLDVLDRIEPGRELAADLDAAAAIAGAGPHGRNGPTWAGSRPFRSRRAGDWRPVPPAGRHDGDDQRRPRGGPAIVPRPAAAPARALTKRRRRQIGRVVGVHGVRQLRPGASGHVIHLAGAEEWQTIDLWILRGTASSGCPLPGLGGEQVAGKLAVGGEQHQGLPWRHRAGSTAWAWGRGGSDGKLFHDLQTDHSPAILAKRLTRPTILTKPSSSNSTTSPVVSYQPAPVSKPAVATPGRRP